MVSPMLKTIIENPGVFFLSTYSLLSTMASVACAYYAVKNGVLKQVAEENTKLAQTRGEQNKDMQMEIEKLTARVEHLEQVVRDKDRKIDELLILLGRRNYGFQAPEG